MGLGSTIWISAFVRVCNTMPRQFCFGFASLVFLVAEMLLFSLDTSHSHTQVTFHVKNLRSPLFCSYFGC